MTVTRTDSLVLDQCRQAVAAEAAHLGGAADTFPAGGCPASIFGRLGSAGPMAGAVDALDTGMRSEFGAAERLLGDVEQAIGAVEAAVGAVDEESARGLTPTVA